MSSTALTDLTHDIPTAVQVKWLAARTPVTVTPLLYIAVEEVIKGLACRITL